MLKMSSFPAVRFPPRKCRVKRSGLAKPIAESVVDLTKLCDTVTAEHGKQIAQIFDFHLGVLRDHSLTNQMKVEIAEGLTTR